MEKKIKKLDDKWFSNLDASIERLKEMKDQIQKELDRRTIKVPVDEDGYNSKDRSS